MDFYEEYRRLTGLTIQNKPSHNRLRAEGTMEVMGAYCSELMNFCYFSSSVSPTMKPLERITKKLGVTDVFALDGTESSVYDRCSCSADPFPCRGGKGRHRTAGKAGSHRFARESRNNSIKAHAAFSVLKEVPAYICIDEGRSDERRFCLYEQYRRICNLTALIKEAYDGDGNPLPELVGRSCQEAVDEEMDTTLDLIVTKDDYTFRVVKVYNEETREWMVLVTSCRRDQLAADQVRYFYILRWKNTELNFKQFKSINSFHSVNSGLKEIVMTFFLGSIAAYLLNLAVGVMAAKELRPGDSFGDHLSPEKEQRRNTAVLELLAGAIKGLRKTQMCRRINHCIKAVLRLCRRDASFSRVKWRSLKDVRAVIMRILYGKNFQRRSDFQLLLTSTWA